MVIVKLEKENVRTDNNILDLEKLRSLASGWGKTATGGDVISLL